jgi:adenylylsulfate kinase
MVEERPKAENLTWHAGSVTRQQRAAVLGQRGVTLWLTGLSGSGKSTLSRALEEALVRRGFLAYVLDGDNVRQGLNRDLGFSPDDRTENIRRIGEVARLMTDAGVICISAFISPYVEDRRRAREMQPEGDFLEVYVRCALEVCEARDPKGLYRRARAGEIANFTGIDAPYEAPDAPEIEVRTDLHPLSECVEQVMAWLTAHNYLVGERG